MKTKHWGLTCLAVCLVLSSYGICMAQGQTTTLSVKAIAFKADKDGNERVSVLCSQSCVPALSSMGGKDAKLIMDFEGVSFIERKHRNLPVPGKYVKKIRSYLDKDTKKLRVVLDMAPSKYFTVQALQDQPVNAYTLSIAEKQRAKGKDAETQEKRISIAGGAQKPTDKDLKPTETAVKQEPVSEAKVVVDEKAKPAVDRSTPDRGRTQMNTGDYAGAIKTFTEIIAENPRESLPYRLRGNAYQNIGDREKAVGDWVTAARLGDTTVQSYLDFMQVKWKEAPKP